MGATRGSITSADREFVETWENIAPFQNSIIKIDNRGDEKHEVILGRRTFMLTTEERIITQDRIIDKANDPFQNGAFRPVVVPETINIETNPNALSDEEIMQIFEASDIAWEEYLKVIDSPATLNRMVDLADEAENMTVKRLRQIQLRLREVSPAKRLTSNDPVLQKFVDEEAAAAERKAQAQRKQGGRSSDYR